MKNKKNKFINELENEIESGLITCHEYVNPEIFLPINPFFRLFKKIFLFFIKMYTKYQIVFNYNIFYTLNKIYQYLIQLKTEQEEKEKLYIKKIKELENKINKLNKKIK